ncbi:hypothetical protein [Stenotrophomonas sp. 278]|uniref:hypothetical protein n=1 Tax=Stenotrophomonas sp. 278 TaxID=2479851 RepID=UPI000F68AB65|nr:hypothetical protein [Stenotrophomonas sp. 278]RRU23583.1 hypothetical protein EGJ34_02770 [Stenotrophomonas sp. 278]
MKTIVIVNGKPVEVPSFHADRLIRNGKAQLPKKKASGSPPAEEQPAAAEPPAVPPAPEPVEQVDSAQPEKLADPVEPVEVVEPVEANAAGDATQDAAPPAKESSTRRGYSRRDMKAKD